jgi:protein-S-isoprenylcysteine O-methyltransferase Ste14
MPAAPASSLAARALLSLVALAAVMTLLVFGTAGTLRYWQSWLYLAVFFGASLLTTLDLMRRDPALLERRMRGGPAAEQRPAQRLVMLGASVGFVSLLVLPGLDRRFHWSDVSLGVVLAGDVLVVVGFYFILRVYRENTFTSATIEIAPNQTVVSTGPYAIVRHPMYASALLYVVGTPLALASYWGLIGVAVMLPFLIWRLFDEERMLVASLRGYVEYQHKVRHRLIPFVW